MRNTIKGFGRVRLREIVGFGAAGGISFALDMIVFSTLVLVFVNPSFANAAGATAGVLANFVLNHVVFVPGQPFRFRLPPKAVRFVLVAALSICYLFVMFEAIVLWFPALTLFEMNLWRAAIILSGAVGRFLALRHWVFQKS